MKQKGFTLIELLVVVAIIGILAAVGTVAYQGYISGARKAIVKSNHKTAVKFIQSEIVKAFTTGEVSQWNAIEKKKQLVRLRRNLQKKVMTQLECTLGKWVGLNYYQEKEK